MWKHWLSQLDRDTAESHPPQDVAIAVLLLECARADFAHEPVEIEAVRGALQAQFGIAARDVDALMSAAVETASTAVSLHGPIARLNAELSPERKRELMHWLWRVACADGRIDAYEEHLLRKLADLLHLPHSEFIRTKLSAQNGE